jgi:hypothetical protein
LRLNIKVAKYLKLLKIAVTIILSLASLIPVLV